MDLKIQERKAIVTGSTAGIGLAIASALSGEGAEVTVNGRTQARVDEAIGQIRKTHCGASLQGVAADAGTSAGCDRIVAAVAAPDILVNNLGIFQPVPFDRISDSDWLRFFEVNVMSGVRLSRAYLPGMMKRNWGRIVFISSESAVNIPVEMIHYGMTKTAQIAVARGLAEMTAGSRVTVNTVLAGPTRSEGVEKFLEQMASDRKTDTATIEEEFFKSVRPSSLIKRFATPDEVAAMVTYICSEAASATNGAALRVEGGVVRSIV